jgi:formylglycine-generating enzyme required for sulfatase activity
VEAGARPGGFPAGLWARFLATDPADRFPSAAAAADALEPFTRPAAPTRRARVSRRGWFAITGGTAAAALAAAVYFRPWESQATVDDGTGTGTEPVSAAPPLGELPMTPDEARALQQTWRNHLGVPETVSATGVGMPFVLVPPGKVPLGQRVVTVPKPYRIGATEVTRGQFAAFVAATKYQTVAETSGKGGAKVTRPTNPFNPQPAPENVWHRPGFGTDIDAAPDAPALYIAARDADEFCRWLTSQEPGVTYRLPTRAELLWAARAGVAGMRPTENLTELRKVVQVSRPAPQRVAQYPPNPWGLYDGLGNLAEWTSDSPPDKSNRRHWCCGCYFEVPAFDDLANSPDTYATSFIGFRVLREEGPPAGPPVGKLAMTPEEAQALQKQWADHLGVPVIHDGPHGMKFALIPPGELGLSTECRVVITKPYYLATCEVTVGQFRAFVEAKDYMTVVERNGLGGSYFDLTAADRDFFKRRPAFVWRTPGYPVVTDDHPVTQVEWEDADEFCKWLSVGRHGLYRLPTEAEWAWAAQAGSTDIDLHKAGDPSMHKVAWLRPNSGNPPQPQPVGKLKPNPWGLCDTIGNVAELCLDFHGDLPVGTHTDYRGKASHAHGWHVIQGDPYYSVSASLTSRGVLRYADACVGFRVVCEVK